MLYDLVASHRADPNSGQGRVSLGPVQPFSMQLGVSRRHLERVVGGKARADRRECRMALYPILSVYGRRLRIRTGRQCQAGERHQQERANKGADRLSVASHH